MTQTTLAMTHPDYLSHPAYGASDIIKMARSFAYWKFRKANPEPTTRPLVIGSVTHLLLEHALAGIKEVPKTIAIYLEGSSRTKGFEAFAKSQPGAYALDAEEYKLCKRMVAALLDEPEVMGYLKDALPETTVISKYPGTDILCKCRPDYLHMRRGVSINIKTTTDATESGFIYSSKDWLYDFQSAFYIDLLSDQLGKPFDEVHILVEKTEEGEPVPIKIFSFGDDTIAWARAQIRTILEKIPECEKSGIWPKNKAFLETVDLPLYARKVVSL